MRRVTAVLVATLLLASAVAGPVAGQGETSSAASADECTFPVTATDATGATVTVEELPERVVVLGPSAAQTLWEIGARDHVVGMPVDRYTSYLNGSANRTDVVDDASQPVAERVVGAQPDLVLAPNVVGNDTVGSLRDRGLTVYRFEAATTLEDVYAKTRLTGRLVGHYDSAADVSARMEGRIDAIESAVAGEDRPRVYYAMGGGWTAGNGSFVHEILRTAGADNVAAGELNRSYGTLSSEVVAREDPEYIVRNGDVPVPTGPAFDESTAVREDQIVTVDANFMNQPGPRTVVPIETLAATFHPDAHESVADEPAEPASVPSCAGAVAAGTGTPSDDGTPNGSGASDGSGAAANVTGATGDGANLTVNETNLASNETGSTGDDSAGGAAATPETGPGLGVLSALAALATLMAGRAVVARR